MNPFALTSATVRIPIDVLITLRDEFIKFLDESSISLRDDNLPMYLGSYIDSSRFQYLGLIMDSLPTDLKTTSLFSPIIFTCIPQIVGVTSAFTSLTQRSISEYIKTKTISNIQQFLILLYEIDQFYKIAEGESFSSTPDFASMYIEISLQQQRISEFSARSILRGYHNITETKQFTAMIEIHDDMDCGHGNKLTMMSENYGTYHCALSAILKAMEEKIKTPTVSEILQLHTCKLNDVNEQLQSLEGVGELEMVKLLNDLSVYGTNDIFPGSLPDYIKVLLLDFKDGYFFTKSSNIQAIIEARKRKRGSTIRVNNSKKEEVFVVLYNGHWWAATLRMNTNLYSVMKKKAPCQESTTIEIFPPTKRLSLDEEYEKTNHLNIESLEEYFKSNLEIQNEIESHLNNKRSVFLHGPAGSGKSHIIMALSKKFNGVITSRDAFVTREVYNTGFTLHSLFSNLDDSIPSQLAKDCEYLFIDEISNICYSWIDKIDNSLRLSHNKDLPFGGVTILWSGDFMQLLPITSGVKIANSLDVFPFLHPSLRKIINEGSYFQTDAPIRFLLQESYQDKQHFAYAMSKLRTGHLTEWLSLKLEETRVPYITDITYPEEIYNTSWDKLPIFICLKNTMCIKLHQEHFGRLESSSRIKDSKYTWETSVSQIPVGTRSVGPDFYVASGCPLLVTSNKVKTIPHRMACNGTLVYFIAFTQNGMLVSHSVSKSMFEITPFRERSEIRFPIKPSIARTVHSCQGMTFEKVYLFFGRVSKTTTPYAPTIMPHQIYVAVSRAKTLDQFKWYCSQNITEFITSDQLCKRFTEEPKNTIFPLVKSMPLTLYDGRIKQFACNVNQQGDLQTYTVKDPSRTTEGNLRDVMHMENSKYTNHSIIYDIETLRCQDNKLMAYGVAFKYYLKGVQVDIQEVWKTNATYRRNSKTNTMYIQWKSEEEQAQRIFSEMLLSMLSDMDSTLKGTSNTARKQKRKIRDILPLYLCGYNINGFDIYEILEELIVKKKLFGNLSIHLIKTTGSSNKGFSIYSQINDKRCCLLKTHDIREIINTGSLSNQIDDWVKPFMSKDLGYFRQGVLTEIEKMVLLYPTFAEFEKELRFKAVLDMGERITKKNKTMMDSIADSLKFHYSHIHERFNSEYLFRKQIKKGCPPLKILDEYNTFEKFNTLIGKKINIWDLIEKGANWERCFYPREVEKAKKHFKQKDLENYDLLNEIMEYAMEDVDLTDLLYRVLNNVIYSFGADTEIPTFQNLSGINGTRTSVLRFKTACNLTGVLSALFLPRNIATISKNKIITELPLYDERMYYLMRRHPGGKVLPRYYKYKSMDWESDYKTYLDISGMYAAAMKNCEYPYGRFTVYRSPADDEILDNIKDQLNLKLGSAFMWIGIVTRSMHPQELDPPAGVKLPKDYDLSDTPSFTKRADSLIYRNDPVASVETNISSEDIVNSGGAIHKIHYLIRWEFSSNIISNYISYLTLGKDKAQQEGQKAKRNFFKLLANAEYGNMGKQNYSSKCVVIPKEERAEFEAQLVKGDFSVTFEELDSGNIIYNYEDMKFGFSDRPTHLSAFILSHSKRLMNRCIQVVFGNDRHTPGLSEKLCPMYGDTDSVVISKEGLDRILEFDKTASEKEKILYYSTTKQSDKLGRFTDELADKHKVNSSFPDFESGFIGRVVEMYSPLPKTYACKYIIPPEEYNEHPTSPRNIPPTDKWIVYYKFCAKGVPKNAVIYPDVASVSDNVLSMKWQRKLSNKLRGHDFKAGDNLYTFECIKFCVKYQVPLKTTKEGISRNLDASSSDKRFSMFGSTLSRTILQHQWGGREEYFRIFYENQIDELQDPIYVPPGFNEFSYYTEDEIEQANTKARVLCDMFT